MEVYGGSTRRKYVSASDIRRMAQGGRKADQIQKISDSHHEEIEIPQAENFLEENISTAYEKPIEKISSQEFIPEKNIFIRLINFFKNFFARIFFQPR